MYDRRGYKQMEWISDSNSTKSVAGKKRTRDVEETGLPATVVDRKKGCDEPMSWWTCLMLGISANQSRVVKRSQN